MFPCSLDPSLPQNVSPSRLFCLTAGESLMFRVRRFYESRTSQEFWGNFAFCIDVFLPPIEYSFSASSKNYYYLLSLTLLSTTIHYFIPTILPPATSSPQYHSYWTKSYFIFYRIIIVSVSSSSHCCCGGAML